MHDLRRSLDILLEDTQSNDWSPLNSATDIVERLRKATQQVADLQHQLNGIKARMSADLALTLRKIRPSLNISVTREMCKVGYKTKCLQFSPNVEQGVWKVTTPNSHRFLREFLKANSKATLIDQDLTKLRDAIDNHFADYYRTLGEELTGTGLILVEDKYATLIKLASWRQELQC